MSPESPNGPAVAPAPAAETSNLFEDKERVSVFTCFRQTCSRHVDGLHWYCPQCQLDLEQRTAEESKEKRKRLRKK